MKPLVETSLLRIYTSEFDKLEHQPLYEALLFAARKQGLAGATVVKGIMSFGASAKVHTAKLIEISEDLPIVVEIVDTAERIQAFLPMASELLEQAGCGGLLTIEKISAMFFPNRKAAL